MRFWQQKKDERAKKSYKTVRFSGLVSKNSHFLEWYAIWNYACTNILKT